MKKETKKIKAYALINSAWKKWDWNNQFQQAVFAPRNDLTLYPLAIFETLKEAQYFNKFNKRKEIKIRQVEIKII